MGINHIQQQLAPRAKQQAKAQENLLPRTKGHDMGNDATTVDEVYFLVRVGTWDQAKLAEYIEGRIADAVYDAVTDEQNNSNYQSESSFNEGQEQGYNRGYQDGRHEGYDHGYDAGMREGEATASRYNDSRDRW
jgi:flagellar biosynthesis/type III secretory pathway protein FliH